MFLQATGNSEYLRMAMQAVSSQNGKTVTARVDFSATLGEVDAPEETGEQTVEDVKKEFYDYLDSLAIAPGLGRTSLSVNITDAAFEKMLADPEYKQRMKDLCARDLCDPAWTKVRPSALVITIDADCEEEYLATSYNHESLRDKADGDSFWSRRTKKAKERREDEAKRAAEKREMLEFLQERADERKRLSGGVGALLSGRNAAAYSAAALPSSAGAAASLFG